jgi:hypothetical protein
VGNRFSGPPNLGWFTVVWILRYGNAVPRFGKLANSRERGFAPCNRKRPPAAAAWSSAHQPNLHYWS